MPLLFVHYRVLLRTLFSEKNLSTSIYKIKNGKISIIETRHKTKVKVTSRMIHPYEKYENTELWKKIDGALYKLVENQDIEEITKREYIIGYICKKLIDTEELK